MRPSTVEAWRARQAETDDAQSREACRREAERRAIVAAVDAGDARALVDVGVRAADGLADSNVAAILRQLADIADPAFARPDDERVGTASLWRQGGTFHMLFQPRFVREHVHTGRCLVFVVLHEILHRLLGHLCRARPGGRAAGGGQRLRGIAADLQVNSMLLRDVFPESPPILARLYDGAELPTALLRSPESLGMGSRYDWEDDIEEIDDPFEGPSAVAEKFRPDPRAEAAAEIWDAVYAFEPATFDATVAKLAALFPEMEDEDELGPILLGSHGDGGEEGGEIGGDGLLAWLRGEMGWIGAGRGDGLRDDDTALVEAHSRELWEAVRRALAPDIQARSRMADVPDQGVVPAAGRREVFLLGTGVVPVLWPTPARQHVTVEEQATIYVDVSGSMSVVLPFVLGLVRHLGDHAGRVFQFSNAVAPLDADALRAGRVRTTGGTDFDCIARHMLARRTRRAVIITDGQADLSAPLERDLARRTKLFVVLTEEYPRCPLLALAGATARNRTWWVLPPALRAGT